MIKNIRLQNFRSWQDSVFDFGPGVNIVVGPNASGKTNLLEAVLVLARGKSYRTKDAGLINFKKPWARLDADFAGQTRTLRITRDQDLASKNFLINDKEYKRLGFVQRAAVVLFEPEHLQFINSGPSRRRDYFDEVLVNTNPAYRLALNRYKRTLAQRNALLKRTHGEAKPQLFAWDVRLGELGAQIATDRLQLVEKINKNLNKIYNQISGKKHKLSLVYVAQFPIANYASRMVQALEKSVQTDFMRGFTSYGPHREDYVFELDGQLLASTASRGESRSVVLALKMLELELTKQAYDQSPILLLDDVFSELDIVRRTALLKFLDGHQVIITTTNADQVKTAAGQTKPKIITTKR